MKYGKNQWARVAGRIRMKGGRAHSSKRIGEAG
jgi:hypothetical protein